MDVFLCFLLTASCDVCAFVDNVMVFKRLVLCDVCEGGPV